MRGVEDVAPKKTIGFVKPHPDKYQFIVYITKNKRGNYAKIRRKL